MFRIDEGSQRTHFFSSQGQFVGTFSDDRLREASLNCGFFTRIDLVPRRKPPTSTALRLTTSMRFMSPSMMPTRLLSCKPVTMLDIRLSPSIRWFARSSFTLTRLSHSPSGAACASKTFALFASALSYIISILSGALLHCFFFLLLPSPCPEDTHQM